MKEIVEEYSDVIVSGVSIVGFIAILTQFIFGGTLGNMISSIVNSFC